MEAAIVERLRRSGEVRLHDTLVNAPLIYDERTREIMGALYQGYVDLALNAGLPMLLCTPTWRANRARVHEAEVDSSINIDASRFMRAFRDAAAHRGGIVRVGGMTGCRNDCYRPDEGLSVSASQAFHAWQVEQLAEGGVDFLIAETLPSLDESLGIALAMQETGLPYIISFVISRDGRLLDGSSLAEAMDRIDAGTRQPPLGYMANCAYPSFLCPDRQPAEVLARLIGFLANASSLDHADLDHADQLKLDDPSEWGDLMLELNHRYGVQILGGCCGTDEHHLGYLVAGRS